MCTNHYIIDKQTNKKISNWQLLVNFACLPLHSHADPWFWISEQPKQVQIQLLNFHEQYIHWEESLSISETEENSCHWPLLTTTGDVILEGLCCLGQSCVCDLSKVNREKKRFWSVDYFVFTDISEAQIILWFSQIFMKDTSRNTRIRHFVIKFSCKRKF